MVPDFAVMSERPGGGHVFLSLVEMTLIDMNPAQRVPVGDQRGDQRQIIFRQAIQRNVAQRGRGRRYSRFGVLLRAIQMRLLER